MIEKSSEPRALIFSYRNIFSNALFRCPHYEFEDAIREIDSAELLAPQFRASGLWYNVAKRLAYRSSLSPNPGIKRIEPQRRYDIFFLMCGQPSDLITANAAFDWKKHCRFSVCLIDEFWIKEITPCRNLLRFLDKFDVIALYYRHTVEPVSRLIRSRCIFVPPAVDTIRFSPYPNPPERVIDVYSIGRRSESTHQKLLSMAAEDRLFYLHDSIAGGDAIHSEQHRALFANVAKRSKYFIVNPGLIDRPDIRGNQIEIGNRYFEGAASGTIMVGERPQTETFKQLFDWSGALFDLPYNSTQIDEIINELECDPHKVEDIRRTNVTQSLLRHDWVYRWESILQAIGIDPLPQLEARKLRLQELAALISTQRTQTTGVSRYR